MSTTLASPLTKHPPIAGLALLLVLGLAARGSAQLVDIQAGRNFPTALAEFGAGRSEDVDAGDIDNDGDPDVVVANGGDLLPSPFTANLLFLNEGGLQGGTAGTFSDVTGVRLPGIPVHTSRDADFADIDGDHDLDIFIANRSTVLTGGEVNRAYVNQGGLQAGTIGFFAEGTDAFWGDLVSVPLTDEEGVQDGQGPFRDHSCDCDFGDLDDDGDLDLFASTYGPAVGGNRDSRVFLNDGAGQFDELWPWADAGADIQLPAMGVSLVDLDDDLDLDIHVANREGQSRLYRNNLAGGAWGTDAFTDVTQTALLDQGAGQTGSSGWETAYGDLDGDGDFDFWLVNHDGLQERLLRNDGGLTFTLLDTQIKGDPDTDDREVDLVDFDGDGDLDAFVSNFTGENWLFQSGLSQGLTAGQGLYHRTGTTLGGSLASWPELPAAGNGNVTKDVDVCDLDGDGDPDLLLANDADAANNVFLNELGVPDTHAPTFHFVTDQGDTSGLEPSVIHAQIRDNAGDQVVFSYDVDLLYAVDGGIETCVPMTSQGGQQFRATIPALGGTISYRVEATDSAGNVGVSGTRSYVHSGVTTPPLWQGLDCGTPGSYGDPVLELTGPQLAGTLLTLTLRDARPNSLFLLWLATPTSTPVFALGGGVYALPVSNEFLLASDSGGMFRATTAWPPGVPPGTEHTWQCLIDDPGSFFGITLSNAVRGTTP